MLLLTQNHVIMKKKNLKSLTLNKNSVSKINNQILKGGTGFTSPDLSCHYFVCATEDCPSAYVKPHCLIRYSFDGTC